MTNEFYHKPLNEFTKSEKLNHIKVLEKDLDFIFANYKIRKHTEYDPFDTIYVKPKFIRY